MAINFSKVPPGIDLADDQQGSLYAAFIVSYVLAAFGVGLRCLCRLKLSRAGFGVDDWLITASLAFATGNFICMIIWIVNGLGRHIYLSGYEGFTKFLSTLFAIEILYTLSIMFTKYSILAFYWRIFGRQNIRLLTFILAPIITAWGLSVIFVTIFQCLPIRGFWDKTIQSTCKVNTDQFFIGNAVPNIITDWTLLAIPLPFIWRLQRSNGQKIALAGIFTLGGFICIISIVRLAILIEAYRVPSIDLTWVFIGPSTWTAVEVNIGILSACLPSLRPILQSSKEILSKWYSTNGNQTQGSSSTDYGRKSLALRKIRHTSTILEESGTTINGMELPSRSINVETTVDIRRDGSSERF